MALYRSHAVAAVKGVEVMKYYWYRSGCSANQPLPGDVCEQAIQMETTLCMQMMHVLIS